MLLEPLRSEQLETDGAFLAPRRLQSGPTPPLLSSRHGSFLPIKCVDPPPAKVRAEYWAGLVSFSARYGYTTPQVLVSCFWLSNVPISRSTGSAERRFSFRIQWLDAPINRVASVNLFRDSSWIVALQNRGELMEFLGGENEVVADS